MFHLKNIVAENRRGGGSGSIIGNKRQETHQSRPPLHEDFSQYLFSLFSFLCLLLAWKYYEYTRSLSGPTGPLLLEALWCLSHEFWFSAFGTLHGNIYFRICNSFCSCTLPKSGPFLLFLYFSNMINWICARRTRRSMSMSKSGPAGPPRLLIRKVLYPSRLSWNRILGVTVPRQAAESMSH